MIVRKTISIVSPSAQKCIDNFPPPLLLSVPRDNGLVARKTGCPLSPNLNDQCPAGNLFANKDTSVELAFHSFSLSSDPHMMSLNIDMKIIRPLNSSGWSPNLLMNSWTFLQSCNVVNPGKYSTRIPSALRQLRPKFCIVLNLWTIPTVVPQTVFRVGFWFIFPRHNTESENTWTFARKRLMTSSSLTRDNCFNGELSWLIWDTPKISSDCSKINCSDISSIFFKVKISPVFFSGMQIVWVILSHERRCFQCRRHKHSPNHRTFVNVLHWIFWRTVQHLSQSVVHSVQEWTWFWRKVRFCDGVRVHIIIDDKLVVDGSPRACSRQFTRFPHLRRPLVVIVPFWGVWWASQHYGYLFAAHLTSSEVLSDFQIWCSPGFQMQSRQARSDPLHGISIPNSSSASILLWLFPHLNLFVFFSTQLQNTLQNWNG